MQTRFGSAVLVATTALLAVLGLGADCSKGRPKECQRLRQCCAKASEAGKELDAIHVACTRQDDDQPVICQRRLDEVKTALPDIADDPACRLGE